METNHQQPDNLPRGKSNWMHKFSASPKYKSFSVKPVTPPMQRTAPMPIHRAATFPAAPQEAPDLGNIIKEFEINYLSPTKQITQQESDKTGKFVKKMVAAFEQKYSSKNKSIKEPEVNISANNYIHYFFTHLHGKIVFSTMRSGRKISTFHCPGRKI